MYCHRETETTVLGASQPRFDMTVAKECPTVQKLHDGDANAKNPETRWMMTRVGCVDEEQLRYFIKRYVLHWNSTVWPILSLDARSQQRPERNHGLRRGAIHCL